jgi:hypothetical protein
MRKKATSPVYPRITIRISPHLEKHLHEVAAIERRKVSDLARLVLHDYCAARLSAPKAVAS